MNDSKTAKLPSRFWILMIVNAVLATVLVVIWYCYLNSEAAAAGSNKPAEAQSPPAGKSSANTADEDSADRLVTPKAALSLAAIEPKPANKQEKETPPAAKKKAVPPPENQPPEKQPQPDTPVVMVRTWAGEPYGVGRINVLLNAEDTPNWRPDRLVFLEEAARRTRYPVIRSADADAAKGGKRITELDVYFLFRGAEPLELTLKTADVELARTEAVRPATDAIEHRQLLQTWWDEFQEDLSNATGNQFLFRSYWAGMLARRLKLQLDVPHAARVADRSTAEIERRFERIVSTLFGIDSVLLAMPDHESGLKQVEGASQPLPTPMRLRSVAVPTVPRGVDIERIAFRVPQDCYYARCHRVKNYLWLRDLLMQWGGSLHEVVAARTIDFDVRSTIERQLAIGAETTFKLGADEAIADLALIGSDLFFRDGTGVGVLLEAKDSALLSALINKQREARLKADPNVQDIQVRIEDRNVSLLLAPGNVVRSYYVVDGNYHLVTNSQDIATKFLQTGRANNGLGNLREFQYARSKAVSRPGQRVWIYVSDPFFRRIVSPAYRIEIGRRAQALAELQELRLAAMTAASEEFGDDSVETLRNQSFLPPDFSIRADGSHAMLVRGVAVDSLRGSPGTFKPIPDMAISRATRSEVAEYNNFRRQYGRQWRAMDPVVVSIASATSGHAHRERVSMRVLVTPYARERYSFLTNTLGPVSSRRIVRLREDLLSLEAGLRSKGRTYQAHVGLHDARVVFRIQDGELLREGPFEHSTFGRRNAYAVAHPSGLSGLKLINRFAANLDNPSSRNSSNDDLSPRDSSPRGSRSSSFLGAAVELLIEGVLLKPLQLMITSASVVHKGDWSVAARNPELLDTVPSRLGFEGHDRPAQVRFRMRDVNSAAVAPYVHAYSFLEARKSSAANAVLLDLVSQQLHVRPKNARSASEGALRARLTCPLGGDYEVADSGWRSSAWATDSYFDVKAAPADYRHPFLNWLRGLDVAFQLSANTLAADIEMLVLGSSDDRWKIDDEVPKDDKVAARPTHVVLKAARRSERIRPLGETTKLRAGDTVIVIDNAAKLRLGETSLANLEVGERLRVVESLQNWVGVRHEADGSVQRAWVHRKYLGTAGQAGGE